MKKIIHFALVCAFGLANFAFAEVEIHNAPGNVRSSARVTTLDANGVATFSSTKAQTLTSTATSGTINVDSTVVTVAPGSASSAVYSAKLCQITTDPTSAAFTGDSHTIGCFGYVIVKRSQALAIGTEGKLKVEGTGVTLSSGASMHCGLEDVTSGNTITNWSCVNAQVTAQNGTVSNGKVFNFTVVSAANPFGNLFVLNVPDLTAGQATNYGGFRCQTTAKAGHFCTYSDGSAQWAISGNTYIGALADNGSSAKLQVTGSMTISGKQISGGSAPAIGACGTSPSLVGRDEAFLITVGTGGVATSCAATFNSNFVTNPPVCHAQNNTDRVAYNIATTTSTVTITAAAAFTAGSKFHVICRGWL